MSLRPSHEGTYLFASQASTPPTPEAVSMFAPRSGKVPDTAPRRQDIDGLRAVAVIAVIIFHLNPTWLKGGFIGVDIFFCISGYVNAAALNNQAGGLQSMVTFIGRRVWRLLPVLMVVVLAGGVFTNMLHPPFFYHLWRYYASGALGLVGMTNMFFAFQDINYFETGHSCDGSNPFTHLWSLGVEEQFYFIFPLLFCIAGMATQHRQRVRFAVLTTLTIVSALTSWFLTRYASQFAFYTVISRFWELSLGTLAFLLPSCGESFAALLKTDRVRGFLQISSLLLLSCALLFTPNESGFPFPLAIPAVVGTVCFMLASGSSQAAPANDMLSHWLPVYIGKLSYSLYLWHWPVFVFFNRTVGMETHPVRILAALAVVLALSMTTYHGIEAPMHKNRPAEVRKICGLVLPLMMLTAVVLWLLAVPFNGILYTGKWELGHSIFTQPHWSSELGHFGSPEICPGGGAWQLDETDGSRASKVTPPMSWIPEDPAHCPTEFAFAATAGRPSILFLGDSTMNHAMTAAEELCVSSTAHKKASCCTVLDYLGHQRSAWIPPGATQGPADHLEFLQEGCMPKGWCSARQRRCSVSNAGEHGQADVDIEYIPVMTSDDVSLQSAVANTTQGTVASYLRSRQLQSPTSFSRNVMVLNTGFHDLDIPHMSEAVYVQNVRRMLKVFEGTSEFTVWVSMNKQAGPRHARHSNAKIMRWNDAVRSMLAREFPKVIVMDVFKMSQLSDMHSDYYHMLPDYYSSLVKMVLAATSQQLSQP